MNIDRPFAFLSFDTYDDFLYIFRDTGYIIDYIHIITDRSRFVISNIVLLYARFNVFRALNMYMKFLNSGFLRECALQIINILCLMLVRSSLRGCAGAGGRWRSRPPTRVAQNAHVCRRVGRVV